MLRQIFVLPILLALLSPAYAGGRRCDDCVLYRYGVHRLVIPTNDAVCVPYTQPARSNVLLRLYLNDGRTRPYTKKDAPPKGCIMVGRSWLAKATNRSYICNDVNHFDYGLPGMIETLARKSKYSREGEACLFGKRLCREMGYPAYN